VAEAREPREPISFPENELLEMSMYVIVEGPICTIFELNVPVSLLLCTSKLFIWEKEE